MVTVAHQPDVSGCHEYRHQLNSPVSLLGVHRVPSAMRDDSLSLNTFKLKLQADRAIDEMVPCLWFWRCLQNVRTQITWLRESLLNNLRSAVGRIESYHHSTAKWFVTWCSQSNDRHRSSWYSWCQTPYSDSRIVIGLAAASKNSVHQSQQELLHQTCIHLWPLYVGCTFSS